MRSLRSTGAETAAAARAILSEVPLDKLYYVQGGAAAWQVCSACCLCRQTFGLCGDPRLLGMACLLPSQPTVHLHHTAACRQANMDPGLAPLSLCPSFFPYYLLQAAGAPWKEPASFSFGLPPLNLSGISGARNTLAGGVQNLASDLKEAPPSTKGLLAAAGVLGASALLFSQVELLLEVAGLVAVGQFLLKVVFAEDREKTLTTIK